MTLGAPVIDSVTRLTGTVPAEGQWVETGRLQSNAAAPPDDLPPPG